MALNPNRLRIAKEKDQHDTDYQCYRKYNEESKLKRALKIPKDMIDTYLKCSDKEKFLAQYGVEVKG